LQNAELAAKAKNRLLRALVEIQDSQESADVLASMTGADILRLIKDAEDRAHGTPVQKTDLSSSDGTMTPKGIPDDVRSALDAIAGKLSGGDGSG